EREMARSTILEISRNAVRARDDEQDGEDLAVDVREQRPERNVEAEGVGRDERRARTASQPDEEIEDEHGQEQQDRADGAHEPERALRRDERHQHGGKPWAEPEVRGAGLRVE